MLEEICGGGNAALRESQDDQLYARILYEASRSRNPREPDWKSYLEATVCRILSARKVNLRLSESRRDSIVTQV
jgi:hypothetical protein